MIMYKLISFLVATTRQKLACTSIISLMFIVHFLVGPSRRAEWADYIEKRKNENNWKFKQRSLAVDDSISKQYDMIWYYVISIQVWKYDVAWGAGNKIQYYWRSRADFNLFWAVRWTRKSDAANTKRCHHVGVLIWSFGNVCYRRAKIITNSYDRFSGA